MWIVGPADGVECKLLEATLGLCSLHRPSGGCMRASVCCLRVAGGE